MTGTWLFPFRIAGRIAAAQTNENGIRLIGPDALRPLTESLNTAFLIDPERMLTQLTEGRGQAFEGVVSYAYPGDGANVLRDCVRCDYFEQGLLIRETDFAIAALWMIRAAIEDGAALGAPFTRTLSFLRWQRGLHLPRPLAVPLATRLILDVTRIKSDTPIAQIVSDGAEGRILLLDPASRSIFLDIFHPPLDDTALERFAADGLQKHGLAGTLRRPGDTSGTGI